MHATRVAALTPVPESTRTHFLSLPCTRAAHDQAFAAVPAFRQVEVRPARASVASGRLRVAAWNLERCLYPEAAAALLRTARADLTLLSEMDVGCHRTGQRHTIAEVAACLGHAYGFGLEFLELRTMPHPLRLAGTSRGNRLGFHGNGFTIGLAFDDPIVIRLDEVADWFAFPNGSEKRIGTRIAVAVRVDLAGKAVVACSAHLENSCSPAARALQMRTLLDAIEDYAHSQPVVIGGDLNVRVQPGGHDADSEPLFAEAAARGYDWTRCNAAQPTTRQSLWGPGAGTCQLDWFCTRGFAAEAAQIIPALDGEGSVLSDHELITVTLTPI
jgi:endonuclease/exonuclease/phosphatase family metal-dependent hydrolase